MGRGQTDTLLDAQRPVRTHLELPQGIVTLLLAGSLLGAQCDELIDALCHRSAPEQKTWGAFVLKNQQ